MPTVLGPIIPNSNSYPGLEDSYLGGGFRVVNSLAERDAIPASRRKAGMRVYVNDTDTVYRLGADLTSWVADFVSGSSVTWRWLHPGLLSAVTPPNPRWVITVGDSMSYGTYSGRLQALLRTIHPGWVVSQRGSGGDTTAMIRDRMLGAVWAGPVRGVDTLTVGANRLDCAPYLPPLNDDEAYSDYQMALRREGTPHPRRVVVHNHGTYACELRELTFLGRCAGNSQAILYEPVLETVPLTNSGNETAPVSGLSFMGGALDRSNTVGSAEGLGAYAARFTLNSATGFHGVYLNVATDAVYEVKVWVYIPAGSVPTVQIGMSGTNSTHLNYPTPGSTYSTTQTGQWVLLHTQLYMGSDGGVISLGFSSGTAWPGAVFYFDNLQIRKIYTRTTDHGLSDNRGCYLLPVSNLVALPAGWRAYRNYYVRRVTGQNDTLELLLSSGGVQDTYTGTGWCLVRAGWRGTYVHPASGGASSTTDFTFTFATEYPEQAAVWVLWAGQNNPYNESVSALIEQYRQLISYCRSGRLVFLSPLTNDTGVIGTAYHDSVRALHQWLTDEYPAHTIDTLQLLMSNHNGSAGDLEDVGNRIVPRSLRVDPIHLNQTGYDLIADAVFQKMIELGYV